MQCDATTAHLLPSQLGAILEIDTPGQPHSLIPRAIEDQSQQGDDEAGLERERGQILLCVFSCGWLERREEESR